MKTGIPYVTPRSLFAAFLAASALFTQQLSAQSVVTDPVGFISVTAKAGSAANPTLTLVSPTLLNPVAWQGTTDASGGVTANTFKVTGAGWTANQYNTSYFVEIYSGSNAGVWSTITATTSTTITTQTDLSSFATAGATIRIRKYTTLSDFLGASNSAGLLTGTEPALADEVLVYNGATPTLYWYYDASDNSGLPAGWKDISYNDASAIPIGPNQGFVIKRKTSGDRTFTVNGTVKTGNTFVPMGQNLNVVGTVSASGLTLAASGLYTGNATTGVKAGTEPALADEVYFTPAQLLFSTGTMTQAITQGFPLDGKILATMTLDL